MPAGSRAKRKSRVKSYLTLPAHHMRHSRPALTNNTSKNRSSWETFTTPPSLLLLSSLVVGVLLRLEFLGFPDLFHTPATALHQCSRYTESNPYQIGCKRPAVSVALTALRNPLIHSLCQSWSLISYKPGIKDCSDPHLSLFSLFLGPGCTSLFSVWL